MGDRQGMQLCGFTYGRELPYGREIEWNINHKNTGQCIRLTQTVYHNRKERPGNTGPCPQKDEDYDAI